MCIHENLQDFSQQMQIDRIKGMTLKESDLNSQAIMFQRFVWFSLVYSRSISTAADCLFC